MHCRLSHAEQATIFQRRSAPKIGPRDWPQILSSCASYAEQGTILQRRVAVTEVSPEELYSTLASLAKQASIDQRLVAVTDVGPEEFLSTPASQSNPSYRPSPFTAIEP